MVKGRMADLHWSGFDGQREYGWPAVVRLWWLKEVWLTCTDQALMVKGSMVDLQWSGFDGQRKNGWPALVRLWWLKEVWLTCTGQALIVKGSMVDLHLVRLWWLKEVRLTCTGHALKCGYCSVVSHWETWLRKRRSVARQSRLGSCLQPRCKSTVSDGNFLMIRYQSVVRHEFNSVNCCVNVLTKLLTVFPHHW